MSVPRRHAGASGAAWVAAAVLLACLLAAGLLDAPALALVPGVAVVTAAALRYPKYALLTCVALVPLSTELYFGGVGLDFPVEPALIATTGLGIVYLLRHAADIPGAALRHPITLLLLAHLAWVLLTTLTSVNPVFSVKFLVAKAWFVIPWYVLAGLWLTRAADVRRFVAFLAVPLAVALVYAVVRHASMGFAFDLVNKAMYPFFRNHVAYAALPSITLPFVAVGALLFPRRSWRRYGLWALTLLMLLAIQTSYTRAAYVSIVAGAGYCLVLRYRLARPALLLALGVVFAFGVYIVSDNNFLRFAPNYEKTITHTDFESLVEATYKLEDISTMERVYRWVAAGYMNAERPWMGFGPGTFATEYRGYAIENFRTYVSENREGSGVHSYYLMTLAEQGWPGLVLFLALCVTALVLAERIYHRAADREERLVILMAAASLVTNLSFQLINDMIETDKAGPWFWYALAILVAVDLRQRRRPGHVVGGGGAGTDGADVR